MKRTIAAIAALAIHTACAGAATLVAKQVWLKQVNDAGTEFNDVVLADPAAARILSIDASGTISWIPAAGGGDLYAANNLSDLSNATTARANLGLAIGSDVQAYDADLTTWAGITPSANAQSLVSATTYAAMRALLDLEVGVDFDPAGTDNSTDVTLAAGLDYLTIAGQEITMGQVDLATDVTGVLPSANLDADTMHLGEAQTVTAAKTFLAGTNLLRNNANTFSGYIDTNATASRIWTLPDASGQLVMTPLRAALQVNGYEIQSTTGGDIVLHSDNNILTNLGEASGADYFGIRDSANNVVLKIDSEGHITWPFVVTHTTPVMSSFDGLIIKLGDAAGADALSLRDSGNVEMFHVDSDGNIIIAVQADPTTDADGEFALDADAWAAGRDALELFDGTASTYLIGVQASDVPTNGQVPKWNTGGTITWEDDATGGGGSGAFSDAGDPVVLNTTTKDVHIGGGAGTLAGKLEIGGDADQPQLVIEAHSTQTDSVVVVQNDADTEVFTVDVDGSVAAAGQITEAGNAVPNVAENATITGNWVNAANPWEDNEVSDTLTSSLFVGAGSTSTAVDLATAEAAGVLPVGKGGTGVGTSGTTSQIAVGGGVGSAIVWTTATGTGSPVRGTAPTISGLVGTGAATFATASSFTMRSAAGAVATASGTIAYDSTTHQLKYGTNGTGRVVANLAEVQTFTNKDLSSSTNTFPTSFEYLYVNAGAMIPFTTNGAAAETLTFTATSDDIQVDTLAFDTGTEEGAGFWLTLPEGWNAGTVQVKFHWTAPAGSGTAKWDIAARAYADDDAIDQALGTEQSPGADTLLATGDMHITAKLSTALTVSGAAAGRPIWFEVTRDVATDTLSDDAHLCGVVIEWRNTLRTTSAW